MYASSRTICSRCASQLRSAQAHRLGGTGTAWFASLSEAADASASAPAASAASESAPAPASSASAPAPASAAPAHGHWTKGPNSGPRRNSRSYVPHQRPGSLSRKKPPLRYRASSEESAVALFNDVVKPASSSRGTPAKTPQPSSLREWEIAAKLKELTERDLSAAERLRIFQDSIWPHLKNHCGQMPQPLFISTTQFLSKTCDDMVENGHVHNSVEFARMCGSIGKLELDVRNRLVLNICHKLAHQDDASTGRNALVRELIDMWKYISQQLRRSQRSEASFNFVLPSANEVRRDIAQSGNNTADGQQRVATKTHPTTRALAAIFPQFLPDQARDLIPGLLATVAVLSDPKLAKPNVCIPVAPLLKLVAVALAKEPATESYVSGVFNDRVRFPQAKLSEIKAYVTSQWPAATAWLSKRDAPWRRAPAYSALSPFSPFHVPTASGDLASFHNQLREAHRSRNPGAVISVWQDLKSRLEQQPRLADEMRDDPEFLDFWLFVWCAVRRPFMLQETLDLMQQIGVHPTVRSYTAMMHGWRICKDFSKISALWDKLFTSDIKLDVVIWTERISGLIEGGSPQAGIQALGEMMALWKKAVDRNAEHTAIQPSIEVINAALKGLLPLDRKAAFEVLEWAGREQIEPNIRTYNILLRENFRSESPEDVQGLLRMMKKQGIEPDAATFTVILEEVLGSMSGASAAEQVQAVHHVFKEIEAAGLRPNLETYGKMLYAVAGLPNGGADEAIAAVQKHMRNHGGLAITPHMVTILLERALGNNPPDKGAIAALLRRHGLEHVGQGDQTLWERIMSAHAVTGDTARAMEVFDDLARDGRPVTSLLCLTDLLRALLARGQRDEARSVVGVVLEYKTKTREETRDPRYWRHHFWYVAWENGLLVWAELPQELKDALRGDRT